MHIAPLIRDLAIILATAAVVTLIFKKIRQPVVLGYLVAGMLVGPHTPPFPLVSDLPNIQTWAELGVIFLMFSLGLEFTFRKLTHVGKAASVTALVEVIGMFAVGFYTGKLFGWGNTDSVFLGGICSISSTTIILKAFEAQNLKARGFAQLVLGVLIVEDLAAILLLVGFTTVFGGGGAAGYELLFAGFKLVLIVGSWIIAGYFFIPSFLRYAANLMDDENLTVFAVALCLLLVYLSAHFGYSPALGAFIMGSILAETRLSHRIQELITPLRDIFAAVFFVSVGMLMDPAALRDYALPIAVVSLVTIIGKVFTTSLGALLAGQSRKRAVQVGFSLAQIGEFSFILAALGLTLKATSPFVYPTAVAVSIITTFMTPYLIQVSEPFAEWMEKWLPQRMKESQQRYSNWTSQTRNDAGNARFKRGLARFFSNGIVVTALFLAIAEFDAPLLTPFIGNQSLVHVLSWMAALLISAPFIWGMFMAFGSARDVKSGDGTILRPFFGHLGSALLLGVLSDRFFSTSVSLVITLVWSGAVFFLFYRRLGDSYRWFEERFLKNLGDGDRSDDSSLFALAPWDLQLTRVSVNSDAPFVGQTLLELGLRKRFGLNVVVIQRGDLILAPPAANDRLFPNDELLLLATETQIEAFQKNMLPAQRSGQAANELSDYSLRRLVIAQGSPLLGKTLQDGQVRANLTGLVVGIERGSTRTTNPAPDTELRLNDSLWIVG